MTWYALAMFFSDKSDLLFLTFKSREPHFSFAQVEWNGLVLNQQNASDRPIVDLSQENLTDLIANLFGPLSFVEICELYHSLDSDEVTCQDIDWKNYFQKSQMQFNDRFIELSKSLMNTESTFRDWCHLRKASSQDLMPLNALQDFSLWNDLSSHFTELNLTRNEGKQIIDLLVDLILLNTNPATLRPNKGQPWAEQLFSIRHPRITQQEETKDLSQGWPQYVQLQKQRQGDRVLQKIQITFTDTKDLNDKLTRLSSMELS